MTRSIKSLAKYIAIALSVICLTGTVVFSAKPSISVLPQRSIRSPYLIPKGYVSKYNYVGAGVLGTVFGFGIGDATLGMWKGVGWAYTFGEILSLLGAGYWSARSEETCSGGFVFGDHHCRVTEGADDMATISLVAFGALRIIESIDLWVRPKVWQKPMPARRSPTAFSLSPLLGPHTTGASLEITF